MGSRATCGRRRATSASAPTRSRGQSLGGRARARWATELREDGVWCSSPVDERAQHQGGKDHGAAPPSSTARAQERTAARSSIRIPRAASRCRREPPRPPRAPGVEPGPPPRRARLGGRACRRRAPRGGQGELPSCITIVGIAPGGGARALSLAGVKVVAGEPPLIAEGRGRARAAVSAEVSAVRARAARAAETREERARARALTKMRASALAAPTEFFYGAGTRPASPCAILGCARGPPSGCGDSRRRRQRARAFFLGPSLAEGGIMRLWRQQR